MGRVHIDRHSFGQQFRYVGTGFGSGGGSRDHDAFVGYDRVGVKEIAEAAHVALTTLFKHFPGKEALVFDKDDDIEAALVASVRERGAGQSIPQALREHVVLTRIHALDSEFAAFNRLVDETPVLRDYAHRMWIRHEEALARVIAEESGAPEGDVTCAALARFALEARELVNRYPDPRDGPKNFRNRPLGWRACVSAPTKRCRQDDRGCAPRAASMFFMYVTSPV
jgi:AcrR family transcriptional regulator